MKKISSNGTRVEITFKTGLWKNNHQEVVALIECNNSMFAELLEKKLIAKLEQTVMDIRKREYTDGLKAGRAKAKKRDWFMDNLIDQSYNG